MPYMGDPENYPPCTDCGCTDKPRYWAYMFAGRCKACIDKWIAYQYPEMGFEKNPFIALIDTDARGGN